MKKIIFTFLLLAALLTGCIPHYELSERGIVQAVGIDKEKDDYLVSLQIFSSNSGGKEPFSAQDVNSVTIDGKGKTISEAINDASLKQGNKLFFGNNKLVVLNKNVCKDDIGYVINFFSNNPESSLNTLVVVSDENADEIVKLKIKEGAVPADFISKSLSISNTSGFSTITTVFDIVKSLDNPYSDFYLPVIKKDNSSKDTDTTKIIGTAIFKDSKLTDTMSTSETKGLLWLNKKMKSTVMPIYTEKIGDVSVMVTSCDTKVKTEIIDNIPHFTYTFDIKSSISETSRESARGLSTDEISKLEKAQADEVAKELSSAISRAVYENKVDVLGLNYYLKKYEPNFWKNNFKNWDNIVNNIRFNFIINNRIDRIGLEFEPNNK